MEIVSLLKLPSALQALVVILSLMLAGLRTQKLIDKNLEIASALKLLNTAQD